MSIYTSAARQAKRRFVVHIVRLEEDVRCGGYTAGPFVVNATTRAGAFAQVRRKFSVYFTDHLRRECRALRCEGVTSDRRGKLDVRECDRMSPAAKKQMAREAVQARINDW